jgi:hypothetical protein
MSWPRAPLGKIKRPFRAFLRTHARPPPSAAPRSRALRPGLYFCAFTQIPVVVNGPEVRPFPRPADGAPVPLAVVLL